MFISLSWIAEQFSINCETRPNQGYHFEHNYGHGTQHLATVESLAHVLSLHARSHPATVLGVIPPRARGFTDEGQVMGQPPQFVQSPALPHDGSLVSPYGVFVRHPTPMIF